VKWSVIEDMAGSIWLGVLKVVGLKRANPTPLGELGRKPTGGVCVDIPSIC
jgi:hypothetical protein